VAFEQLETGFADDRISLKPEEGFRACIPRTNVAAVGHRERGIGGALEQAVEVAVVHRRRLQLRPDDQAQWRKV